MIEWYLIFEYLKIWESCSLPAVEGSMGRAPTADRDDKPFSEWLTGYLITFTPNTDIVSSSF